MTLNYETSFATRSSLPATRRSVLGAEFFGSQSAQYSQKNTELSALRAVANEVS